MLIELSFLIGFLISFILGTSFYFFPQKFLNVPFIDIRFWNTQKSVKAFWNGLQSAYGKEEGIKELKSLGLIYIFPSFIVIVIFILFLFGLIQIN